MPYSKGALTSSSANPEEHDWRSCSRKTPRVEQRNCNKRKPQLRKVSRGRAFACSPCLQNISAQVDVDLGCETPPQEILGHVRLFCFSFNSL